MLYIPKFLLSATVLAAFAGEATAAVVRYSGTATIIQSEGPIAPTGATVPFVIEYEPGVALDSGNTVYDAVRAISFGDVRIEGGVSSFASASENTGSYQGYVFTIRSAWDRPSEFLAVTLLGIPTLTDFTVGTLPAELPPLAAFGPFNVGISYVVFPEAGPSLSATGAIVSLQQVPSPGPLGLAAAGVAALGFARGRRRSR